MSENQSFGLVVKQKNQTNTFQVSKTRLLLGSSDRCDYVIGSPSVSGIHAVVEQESGGLKIYDMNSLNGTFVNGEKVVYATLREGDIIKLSDVEIKVSKSNPKQIVSSSEINIDEIPLLPTSNKKAEGHEIYESSHPLRKLKQADFSKYIFEDGQIRPIFSWKKDKESVEVLTLLKNVVLEVHYRDLDGKDIYLAGNGNGYYQMEYPYLGKKEKHCLVSFENGAANVNPLPGFKVTKLSKGQYQVIKPGSSFSLQNGDLACLTLNDLQMFVMIGERPPKVKRAPLFQSDKDLNKYLLLMLLFFLFILLMTGTFYDKEKIENKFEKEPERVARILYKKLTIAPESLLKVVEKEPTKVKEIDKNPKEKVEKQENDKIVKKEIKPVVQKTAGLKTEKKKGEVKKATPNRTDFDRKSNTVTKSDAPKKSGSSVLVNKAASTGGLKTDGHVDTYQGASQLSSSLNTLLAKSGDVSNVNAKNVGGGSSSDPSTLSIISGAGGGATLKTAKVEGQSGAISGMVKGKLDSTKGLGGVVSAKTSFIEAGMPYKTVVLGGMDPDIIRKILMEHLPQFRYCYQKILDRTQEEYSGIVKLNFIIGASGHVTRADAVAASGQLPGEVRDCVRNVLLGIGFPAPAGGGRIEVDQPMNFYAKTR